MTRPVFLGEDLTPSLEDAQIGGAATLAGAEGHHAASVRRIGVGEWIDVVDGHGLRAVCQVRGNDKASLSLVVRELKRHEAPSPQIVLVQALAKGGRDEAAVEICTEIGVDHVIPWASQRAIVQWRGPKADRGRAKWEAVARAAAKQSRRAFIPGVEDVKDTGALAQWLRQLTDEGGLAFVCHEEATDSLGAALAQACAAQASMPARIALIVGPEGGIGTEETRQLLDAGAAMISLGDNVLRSSTAGAVALTLIRAAAGAY